MMGGTGGRIRCSDWPTKPPVMDACLLIRSLGKNPALEPTKKKRIITLEAKFNQ